MGSAEVGPDDLLLGLGRHDGLLAYGVTTEQLFEEVASARAVVTGEPSAATARPMAPS